MVELVAVPPDKTKRFPLTFVFFAIPLEKISMLPLEFMVVLFTIPPEETCILALEFIVVLFAVPPEKTHMLPLEFIEISLAEKTELISAYS